MPELDAISMVSHNAGLPEEVNITRVALHRGYALVALSSAARNSHKCWHASAPLHHPQDTKDVANVSLGVPWGDGWGLL